MARDFRVADWLVEPSLDRLSRNGTAVHLRPQLTNLLVLFASRAGRTVSKDEILASVWERQFVAESGLSRCVAELRRALEDDARAPRILETIPKRGYRLIAPVAFVDAAIAAAPIPEVVVREEGSAAPAPPGRRRSPSLARRAAFGVMAALLLGAAGAWLPREGAPDSLDRKTVLLADVKNTTGEAGLEQTLHLALAARLSQAPFLHVLSADDRRTAAAEMGRPQEAPVTGEAALEVCRRDGAVALLAGSIARLGSHYALGLEATACGTGESLHRELLEVESKDRLLSALEGAAARLQRTLQTKADLLTERGAV